MSKASMKDVYTHDKNYASHLRIKSGLIMAFCIFLTILSIFPFVVMIVNATRDPNAISTGITFIPDTNFKNNWEYLIDDTSFDPFTGFKNSLIVTFACVFLTVFVSTLTAYGLTVYDFRLKNFASAFIYAVLMIPVQVSAVGNLKFMRTIELYDTLWAVILPAAAAPAVVFFIKQYMKSSFPVEIV